MQERISAADSLRGLALLGLLPMNILVFALPMSSYFNPASFQGDQLSTHISHFLTSIVFDQKMMGLFSFLFGCSLYFICFKQQQLKAQAKKHYYIRNLWLLGFGLVHAIFIWEGDILTLYALCAFLLYPCILLSAKTLVIIATLLWSAIFLVLVLLQAQLSSHAELTSLYWHPNAQQLSDTIAYYLLPYGQMLSNSTQLNALDETIVFNLLLVIGSLRAFSMMLIGLAFSKALWWKKPIQRKQFLVAIAVFSLACLLGVVAFILNTLQNWQLPTSLGFNYALLQLATPMQVLAMIFIMLYLSQQQRLASLQRSLAQVGRMAFTLYISQSVCMTGLFYGWGLGLFASLDRLQLSLIVLISCIVQLLFAHYWFKHFQQGPLEYIWRSLVKISMGKNNTA